jgi:Zn-dependent protease
MNDKGDSLQPPPGTPPPIQPYYSEPPGSEPTLGQKLKKIFGPIGVVLVIIAKFFAKLKFILLPAIKFLPILLQTGGSMLLFMWVYARNSSWSFGVGLGLLILVHECGHLIVARFFGLKVGAPVFIPFMGALIALKEAPKDAWMEAWVGIGGPLMGTFGAVVCFGLFKLTGNSLFLGLAFTAFFMNLFNLAPIGFLDGGRIVTALSPWMWLIGLVVMLGLMISHPNFIVGFILVCSIPRLISLFTTKTDEERRYYEIGPARRVVMAGMYFGLIAFLFFGMVFARFVANQ